MRHDATISPSDDDFLLDRARSGDGDVVLRLVERIRGLATADLPRAVSLSQRLVEAVDSGTGHLAKVLAARAHALSFAGEFRDAVACLDRAAAIARESDNPMDLGLVLLGQVQPLARLGCLSEAESAARSARACFERAGDIPMLAKATVNLGICLRMLGRAAEALSCFDDASSHLSGDPPLESNRAEALLDLDRFDEAERAFERALSSFLAAGHSHGAAIVESNLADLYSRMGRVDEAIVRFESARRKYDAIESRADSAGLAAEEAEALLSVGAYSKAIRLYRECITELRGHGLLRESSRASLGLGIALMKAGDPVRAEAHLQESVSLADSCGSADISADARVALGECRAEMARHGGDHASARGLVMSAIAAMGDRPLRRSIALAALARLEIGASRPVDCMRAIESARRMPGIGRWAPIQSRLRHTEGLALWRSGRPAEALTCFLDAIRSVDEVRGTIRAEQIRAASTESTHDLYSDACSAALDADPPELVSVLFDIVERMRARTLLDSCAGAVTGSSSVSPPWTALENELHHLYRALGTGAWARSVDESGLRARIDRIESQLEAMNDRAESAGASRRRAFAPITMEEARASLPDKSAVCIFFRDRDHLAALALTDRGGVVRPRIAPIAEIERLSRRVRFEVDRFAMMMSRSPEAGGVDPTGSLRRVWNLILEPLMSECSGRDRIHLVPCKHLHTLPLCAAGVQYDPTGAMYSLTPSVSVGLELARRARESAAEPASSLIVGVADELAPHAGDEAKEVADCADRSMLFSGQDASAGTFLSHLSGASLIHLACHCVFEPQFAMSSRVRLADRWVTAREISGRLRRGCTAILAACDSGRGSESGNGEDRFGLLRAFLASGASAVVASLWTLHDETARRLFTDMHRRINRSRRHPAESVTRSLRDAQTELAQQGMPWTLWGGVFAKGAIT